MKVSDDKVYILTDRETIPQQTGAVVVNFGNLTKVCSRTISNCGIAITVRPGSHSQVTRDFDFACVFCSV